MRSNAYLCLDLNFGIYFFGFVSHSRMEGSWKHKLVIVYLQNFKFGMLKIHIPWIGKRWNIVWKASQLSFPISLWEKQGFIFVKSFFSFFSFSSFYIILIGSATYALPNNSCFFISEANFPKHVCTLIYLIPYVRWKYNIWIVDSPTEKPFKVYTFHSSWLSKTKVQYYVFSNITFLQDAL